MALLDGYAREYGRDPDRIALPASVPIWVGEPPPAVLERAGRGERAGARRAPLISGTPEAIEARLREYIQAGITLRG